ncbi:hypothetical protein M9Y10_031790 [Tritrichomonas musculus]|uniref:Uncharacterized protein n=1 Tax=Tritrichomonas musculus TaxID=1915356 RepID=A0ABR2GZS3_9EUKA
MSINLGSIKVGQKYEFPVFKEVTGVFTPTKNAALLLDGAELGIFYDSNYTQRLTRDGPNPELHFTGFGNGGKVTFEAKVGKTYYFWSGKKGCMNSKYLLLTSLDNLEVKQISPPDGSVFEIAGYGASDIEFNQPVNFESAFITYSSKTIPVTPRKNTSSINVEMKNQLWSLYKDGSITKEGQKFTLTIKGIKTDSSTLYNGDGTLTINYLTCPKPISVTNIQAPSVFLPVFNSNDKDSFIVLTFDGKLNEKPPIAELLYGVPESGDFYHEKLNTAVEDNRIRIDLSGKRRTPKDMLRSGNVYPTVAVKASSLADSKGHTAWSDDPGALGSLTININYKP